jgi:hypothetical protein
VGFWLAMKQHVALRHITDNGPGRQTAANIQQYFMDVQFTLDFWVRDDLRNEWFQKDAERLNGTRTTIKQEEELSAPLLHE